MSFTEEHTQWPGNIIVSTHVSAHSSSEMANYDVEKPQYIVYEQK